MASNGRRKILVGALLVSGALVAFGVLLGTVLFPAALRSQVLEKVKLYRGSEALQRFVRLSMPVHFKAYIFNVTNPDEVHAGHPPVLREMGPYVYNLMREKFEMEEDFDTDTLTFYQKAKFIFNRELSVGKEDDPVTSLNVPMLGMLDQIAKTSPTLLSLVNVALPDMFPDPDLPTDKVPTDKVPTHKVPTPQPRQLTAFIKTTVGRLVFQGVPIRCSRRSIFSGFIKSLVCTGLGANLPPSIRRAEDSDPGVEEGDFLFSFLGNTNDTRDGPMTVRRGLTNSSRMGEVVSWKHQTMMKAWGPLPPNTSPCNEVKGIGSSVFPPFMDENTIIHVFQPEMCRSLSASFEKHILYKGMPGLRFVLDSNLFDSPDHNPDNWCYYPAGDDLAREKYWSRTESGVQDISGCIGAPLIVSYPHFYAGSKSYLNYARGLQPEKELHESYVDMEPFTGAPMSAAKRLQFNMYLKRMSKVTILRNVSEGVFPIMWMEEGADLDEKFSKMLKEGLFDVMRLLDIIKWLVICFGILGIVAVLIVAKFRWWTQSGDSMDEKMKEANQLPTYEMSKTDVLKSDVLSGFGDCIG